MGLGKWAGVDLLGPCGPREEFSAIFCSARSSVMTEAENSLEGSRQGVGTS